MLAVTGSWNVQKYAQDGGRHTTLDNERSTFVFILDLGVCDDLRNAPVGSALCTSTENAFGKLVMAGGQKKTMTKLASKTCLNTSPGTVM